MAYEKKNKTEVADMPIPPQSIEIEQSVLGTIIYFGNKCLEDVAEIIKPSSFYEERNATIFSTLIKMASDNEPISLTNVAERLRTEGKIDDTLSVLYLSNLSSKAFTSTDLVNKAIVLRNYEIRRGIINISLRSISMANTLSEDLDGIVDGIEHSLIELTTDDTSLVEEMDSATSDFYEEILRIASNPNENVITTGLRELDKVFNGGFHNSELIVFGGRPGNGKTSLSLFFSKHAAMLGKKTLYVNIEMTTSGLIGRLVSDGISYNNLRSGKLSKDEWNRLEWNLSRIKELPLSISSSCNNFNGIVSMARKRKRNQGLDFLVIDYLQLIEPGTRLENKRLEIGYMTRRLKALAKELNIPILLLSQLSRPEKGAENRKPRLESLRESGDIEQDADIVIFTHIPDKNTMDENTNRSWYGRGMIVVAKNREGEKDVDVIYAHDPAFKQFVDDGNDDPAWKCGDFSALHSDLGEM